MMTLITGLPGAGKTALTVERYLMTLAAKNWEEDATTPEGEPVKVKRRLHTNINGLLLEHERIGPEELAKWHEWVKPGDLIVYDEVQKPWPLTATGSKQPECIEKLETHRHYGVDFILLTQHPMLVNVALPRLCAQHLHVRKLGASRFATVYEWDGVSRTLLYKNCFAKKAWRRSKAVEGAYRSSDLHTKQKRSVPTVLWVLLVALLALPVGFYYNAEAFKKRYFSKPEPVKVEPATGAPKPSGGPWPSASPPVGGQVASVGDKAAAPVFSGCVASKTRCSCLDTAGAMVEKDYGSCVIHTKGGTDAPPISLDGLYIADQERHAVELAAASRPDTELVAWARQREAKAPGAAVLHAPPAATAPLKSKTPERSAGTVATAQR
jgi:zona occludens toxin